MGAARSSMSHVAPVIFSCERVRREPCKMSGANADNPHALDVRSFTTTMETRSRMLHFATHIHSAMAPFEIQFPLALVVPCLATLCNFLLALLSRLCLPAPALDTPTQASVAGCRSDNVPLLRVRAGLRAVCPEWQP